MTHLIGKDIYQDAGEALELYLVDNPDQVAISEIGFGITVM